MNLSKHAKRSIVRAIMGELPSIDYDQMAKDVQAKFVAAMSPECQAVYAKTPNALVTDHIYNVFGYCKSMYVGDLTEKEIEKITAPYKQMTKEREEIETKLNAAFAPIRTRKQFINQFPEFSQHAPAEDGTCATLPAIANIVADLVKLGWEPKVTKADHAKV